jgi:uncharacterized membrane protein
MWQLSKQFEHLCSGGKGMRKSKSVKEIAVGLVLLLISATFLSFIIGSIGDLQTPLDENDEMIVTQPEINNRFGVVDQETSEGTEPLLSTTSEVTYDSQRGAETSVVRTAIRKGLDYLVTSQGDAGGWDTMNYGSPVALASFGLRAFLDYQALGETQYAESLQKSVQFLKDNCHDPGIYQPGHEQDYWGGLIHNDKYDPVEPSVRLYSHGAATLALIDYYWATKDEEVLMLIQNAVDLIFRAQHTEYRPASLGGPVSQGEWHYGGWRYTPDHSSADMSLTGWQVLALVSAKEIGFNFPNSSLEAAKVFINNCFNADGAVSYTPGGAKASDLTAIAVFCLLLMGENVTTNPNIQLGLDFLRDRAPFWEVEPDPGHVYMPFYYWYYATQVWYQIGEEDWIWWNSSVTDMLIQWQNDDGSWDANQFEGDYLGKDFTTALAILILQISRRGVYLHRWSDPDTGVGETLSKEVRLDGNVTYNLTVTSVGKGILIIEEDNVTLTITDPPEGWTAYLETPTPNDPIINENGETVWWVPLSSMESANITLHVKAPPDGDIGDICYIVVHAWSSENEMATDSLTSTTYLVIDLDFQLEYNIPVVTDKNSDHYGEKWIELAPGAKTVLYLAMANLGELNDTYDLRIEGLRPGWDTKFVESGSDTIEVSLSAETFEHGESSTELHISVEVPSDAQAYDVAVIKIVGESQYSHLNTKIGILKREDTAILTTSEKLGIDMGCEDPVKYVNPGDNVSYNITVYNLGNYQVTVLLSNTEISQEWSIELPKSVMVLKEAIAKVIVTIRAPYDAVAGSRLMVTVTGTTVGEIEFSQSIVLTTIVNMRSDITTSMSPHSATTDPGGTVSFNLSVTNLGNGKDMVALSALILEPKWNMKFVLNSTETDQTELEYLESKVFRIYVETIVDADPGTYRIGLNITSTTQTIILYANVVVNQVYEVSVRLYDEDLEQFVTSLDKTTSPSQPLKLLMEVRNEGNGPDTVELEVKSTLGYEDWEIYFSCVTNSIAYSTNIVTRDFNKLLDVRYLKTNENFVCDEFTKVSKLNVVLNKDQKLWVRITAGGPLNPSNNLNTFKVTVESEGQYKDDPLNNEAIIRLTLLFPDLAFSSGITVPKQLEHGELTSVSIYIKNTGEFEANDFLVSLKVDGHDVKSVLLNKITEGGEILVTFTWQATSGDHELLVEIDPDNRIIEKNDQFRGLNNNVESRSVEVGSGGPLGASDLIRSVCSVFMVIFIIIFIVIIMLYAKRRGWVRLNFKPRKKKSKKGK